MNQMTNPAYQIDDNYLDQVEKIAKQHSGRAEDLVLVLHKVQALKNYLPRTALNVVAKGLNVSESHVYGVATYYSMLSTKPRGRHIIRICESAPCHVQKARELIDAMLEHLDIEIGGTTKDGRFTVETTSCLGLCAVAPVVMIDDKVYGNLDRDTLFEVLTKYN
ncbi:MAG: NADH-quinone oxidoreductase subunit NuoE [Firmicutes bacterium]|nr:NADH-quinone oxidoreductase subunit NuoE [Bacillota bacterium]MDD4263084.1 NADH-quinone oxidoreductase subunit NuoE [Bacillota bacterium]MDD4694590.1 NADH-quinone oxidoreductase subunit NuoE [Bacillota bacterium]